MQRIHALFILGLLLQPVAGQASPDGTWNEHRPLHRAGHAAIHDAIRDRMIVVGGVIEDFHQDPTYDGSTSDVWVLSLADPTVWTSLQTAGPKPPRHFAPAVIYDAGRDRIVMWGGRGASPEDVWILTLSGTPTWSQVSALGTPPSARHGAAADYDPVRSQLVLFGGYDDAGVAQGDVWRLALNTSPTWTQIAPSGTPPVARAFSGFRYDPPRDRFVVVGGECASAPTYRNDVWSLELSGLPSWTPLGTVGGPPPARARSSMVYAPATDRFILFGGYHDFIYENDLWSLDVSGIPTWSAIAPAGIPPSVRDAHVAIYDLLRNRMLVHGGNTFYGGDEGWILDLSGAPAWAPMQMPFARPDARRGGSVIVDLPNQRLVAFGGGAPNNETWVAPLGGSAVEWTKLTTGGTAPPALRFHSAVLDPVRRRMVVFGGLTTGGVTSLNDVWALPLDGAPDWVQLAPTGTKPSVRSGHSAIYDPLGDRMVIFGGTHGTSDYSDVYAMTLGASPAWTKLFPSGAAPPARSGAVTTYQASTGRMLVFGGYTQGSLEFQGDTWGLQLGASPAWIPLLPNHSGPSARGNGCSALDTRRNRLILFGGTGDFGASTRTNETWALDLGGMFWSQLAPAGFIPAKRSGAFAAYDSLADRMVVYSGFTGFEFSDVNWTLDFADPTVSVPWPGAITSLALHGAMPNPVAGDLVVSFRLPDAEPARLELFDLAGRRIETKDVGALGPGRHTTTLAPARRLAAGVYMIRLTRGNEERTARAVVLR